MDSFCAERYKSVSAVCGCVLFKETQYKKGIPQARGGSLPAEVRKERK